MTAASRRPGPKFSWFVPIDGDGEHIGTERAERPPSFEYLSEVVRTAENAGYHSLLIPTRFSNGLFEETAPLAETWTMATALLAVTSRIRLLIAVRPGFISPGLFAQMAGTLDQISGGRVDLNVVPGGIQGDFERLGEHSDHEFRYERGEEFIAAIRALWAKPEPVVFNGEHVRLNGAMVSPGPVSGGPLFYLGGASDNALGLAARQGDVLLGWIGPVDRMDGLLERARGHFADAGRTPRFGLRTHIVTRDTEDEAWQASEGLLSQAAGVVREQRQAQFAGTAMVGQRLQLAGGDDHRIGPHLWNGISTVRVNCGTAIVGDHSQVASELLEYWRIGMDEFILSGFPHREECVRVAEEVIPLSKELIEAERSA